MTKVIVYTIFDEVYLAHSKELKDRGEGEMEINPSNKDLIKHEVDISDEIWKNANTEKIIGEIKKMIKNNN